MAKLFWALSAVLISFFSIILADGSNVVVLTPSNFDTIIDGSKHALVEFYAPWCGHCKNLAPVYEELGDAFAHAKKDIIIAKVDADEHKDLGNRFGVRGFPTLKWFPKGTTDAEDYNSGRDLESFTNFIKDKTAGAVKSNLKKTPTAVTILTTDNFNDVVLSSGKNVLVEFYAPWCGHCKNLAPTYEKVAKTFSSESNCLVANIDATTAPDLSEKYGVTGYPTIKFFSEDKSDPISYEGGRSEDDFVDFLNEKCGTHRTPGGGLNEKAGIIPELEEFVTKLHNAPENEKANIVADAVNKKLTDLKENNAKYAKYYLKVMKKFTEDPTYPLTESSRLEKIVSAGQMTLDKMDDFLMRKNILRSFISTTTAGSESKQEL